MQIIALTFILLLIAIYIWHSFPGMVKAGQIGDLAMNTLLIALVLYTLPWFIWRRPIPSMASFLSWLLQIPVQFIYGPWL